MASTISAGTTTTTALVQTADTSGILQFQTNGTTTALTIDASQNVGIGTPSPGARLDVNGDIRITYTGTGNTGLSIARNGGTASNWYNYIPSGSTDLRWFSGADFMTLNSSGNLGLGVTPIASVYTSSRNLFVGQASNLIGRTTINFTSLNTNVYEAPTTSTPTYINSASAATQYIQYLGAHTWQTSSGSPSAGNAITFTQAMTLDASGNLGIGTVTTAAGVLDVETAVGAEGVVYCIMRNNNGTKVNSLVVNSVSTSSYNTAVAALWVGRAAANARSINAGGTVNASGADYAEYMTKAGNFTIAKGDVVGINAQGKLTNVFADAVSFCVKSTDPSYVGGDVWGSEKALGLTKPEDDASQEKKDAFNVALETARQTVDRIAFAGQVPVNVTGATAGQYIVPVANQDGSIGGQSVSESAMTLQQYMQSVGKVISVVDNVTTIIVKVA